jgi:hypothetical protein
MDSKVFTPLAVPTPPTDLKPPALLEGEQEEKRLQVLAHFSSEEYRLPNVEENQALMEAEKFWLVSFLCRPLTSRRSETFLDERLPSTLSQSY